MKDRVFRKPESYVAEEKSRDMISDFLSERGFSDIQDVRRIAGVSQSQTVSASSPKGLHWVIKVRLCWRRDGRKASEQTYSAAQLLNKLKDGDWIGSLEHKVNSEAANGVTHFLLVQRDGEAIVHAALIPISKLVSVWSEQRAASEQSVADGKAGKRHKNHAANGTSPTLWLQDDSEPHVTGLVWRHSGVIDLLKYAPIGAPKAARAFDDTWDDQGASEDETIGSDNGAFVTTVRSHVKRDAKVRLKVLTRSGKKCERVSCKDSRPFAGFLDVHHILGAAKSDRVWNCVALCPNCHREAHWAPDRDAINAKLLKFANRFMPVKQK